MEAADHSTNNDDYVAAKILNNRILHIFHYIKTADEVGIVEGSHIDELNRVYILLVDELQRLYEQNPDLAAIKPEPLWRRFDVLKTATWDITEYIENEAEDYGQAHFARIERLCILAGVENEGLSPNAKHYKLIESADSALHAYSKMIHNVNKKIREDVKTYVQIGEYSLIYKSDGTILINDVLKLKKVHAGSTTERLLEQAVKRPNELFKPDLGQTSRNLSTVLSSAGITPTLRQLFFPTVSKTKGVVFRPNVTREQADTDNIDTTELDHKLIDLGAETEPKKPESNRIIR